MSLSLLNPNIITDRLNILKGLGFKLCTWEDEDGIKWPVYSISDPDSGYKLHEIADMPEPYFTDLISFYLN